ncbi:NUDIX hydrolase [Aureimonas sp. SA4125]|uniref:NUDIX domain-containing protein n=1 Tax=Aureimonas sp. SA4125 TaxID=2826993 RepID=UPI001CC37FE2|nr:NUDIX domain-containing protein [Aureimonas sp. SA4125]BDA85848.1 NUDIX hydrolase [Aureimonas sp. SA4125]
MKAGLKLRLFHLAHVLMRPMTLGTRCAAYDETGRIFLVRHSYIAGWHMPGGGVDPGETIEEGMRRELREEGNLVLADPPRLVALYFNDFASRRDHVAFYVCRNVRQTEAKPAGGEIAESGFFDPAALPEETSPATRRRLAELASDGPFDPYW